MRRFGEGEQYEKDMTQWTRTFLGSNAFANNNFEAMQKEIDKLKEDNKNETV